MSITRQFLVGLVGVSLVAASCGGDDAVAEQTDAPVRTEAEADEASAGAAGAISGFTTISAQEAAAITENPPSDLVVLDVRTPEEYAAGRLADSVLIDFYDADFADQLAELDRDVPYLVYCRSGNRSGETLSVMQQLGFTSVTDVNGGILAWADAGLPVTTD